MDRLKKILAPTDLSDLSLVGLREALKMAASTGAEVIAYHVINHEEVTAHYRMQLEVSHHTSKFDPVAGLMADRRELLAEYLSENLSDLISGIRIRKEVEIGIPHKRIVEKAAEEGADLIIMSTHGRSGLLHMLIGSVTEKVVRRATCPVLSIHPVNEAERTRSVAGRDLTMEV